MGKLQELIDQKNETKKLKTIIFDTYKIFDNVKQISNISQIGKYPSKDVCIQQNVYFISFMYPHMQKSKKSDEKPK